LAISTRLKHARNYSIADQQQFSVSRTRWMIRVGEVDSKYPAPIVTWSSLSELAGNPITHNFSTGKQMLQDYLHDSKNKTIVLGNALYLF